MTTKKVTTSDTKIDYDNLDWETVDYNTFDWDAYDAYQQSLYGSFPSSSSVSPDIIIEANQ